MSNAPITVAGRALPEAVTKNIVRGPIIKPEVQSSSLSKDTNPGFNQSVYRVKLVANGRTFNMLLPPSIESKHPGRSNPLQLPGLQIESTSAISKLKIPGFFPIYQHLGVESLYISMSGMFTGYDGEDQISTAGNWEGWDKDVKGGQDAYTAACDLFDFAVKNKALTTVTISTSDGSFDPKKSTATNFRDERSNIRFKGYIKELKQIYIRQDRVYYMLKFEIIDLGSAKCNAKADKNAITKIVNRALNPITNPITDEDRKYFECIEQAQPIVDSINNGEDVTKIIRDIDDAQLNGAIKIKLALYAQNKGLNVATYLTQLQDKYNTDSEIKYDINIFKRGNKGIKGPSNVDTRYRWEEDIKYRTILCNEVKGTNCNLLKDLKDAYDNDLNNNVTSTTSTSVSSPNLVSTSNPVIQPATIDYGLVNDNLGNSPAGLKISKALTQNNGNITSQQLASYVTNSSLSPEYKFSNKVDIPQPSGTYPPTRAYLTFTTKTGSLLYLVPNDTINSSFTLKKRVNNEFL